MAGPITSAVKGQPHRIAGMDERHARHEECEIAANISTLAADRSTLLYRIIWRLLLIHNRPSVVDLSKATIVPPHIGGYDSSFSGHLSGYFRASFGARVFMRRI
jgi:hypothetical protein